jgi:hypothetical protein
LLELQQQQVNGHVDLRLGFIRLEWALFEGGRRIAATRVADSQVRQAMAQAESIIDNIAFQVNEAYRNAVTAWVSIDDARPAVDQATENYRLVRLRLREGAAIPSEIADAQASLTRAQQNYLNARYGYLIAMDRLAMPWSRRAADAPGPGHLAEMKPKHTEQPMSTINQPRLLRETTPPRPRPPRIIPPVAVRLS